MQFAFKGNFITSVHNVAAAAAAAATDLSESVARKVAIPMSVQ